MAIKRKPLESLVDRPIDRPIDIRVPWLTQLGSLSIAQLYLFGRQDEGGFGYSENTVQELQETIGLRKSAAFKHTTNKLPRFRIETQDAFLHAHFSSYMNY